MAKYNEKMLEKIVSLIEEDTYSISEICTMLQISRKSFYEWKKSWPEFSEAVDKAIERRDEELLALARRSLRQKLQGYTLTEKRVIYEPCKDNPKEMKVKSEVVKTKEYPPDTRSIKLVLEREDRRRRDEGVERVMKEQKNKPEERIERVEVVDREAKRQMLIMIRNKGMGGGLLDKELVARVDHEMEWMEQQERETGEPVVIRY